MVLAPIAFFVYKRPEHTKKTLEALAANELASESELFIFSDGARNEQDEKSVLAVREYIRTAKGFKSVSILEHVKNQGLAKSLIGGITELCDKFGRVIVVEDDVLTSPYFLRFMNDALNLYENEEKVASVNAYMYPIEGLPETFFLRAADCWGWGTWQRAWNLFNPDGAELLTKIVDNGLVEILNFYGSYSYLDMLKDQIEGKNDSWAIRWSASVLLQERLGLYVGKTMAWNIGFDGSGVHSGCVPAGIFGIPSEGKKITLHPIPLIEDKGSAVLIGKYLSRIYRAEGFVKKIARKLFRCVFK